MEDYPWAATHCAFASFESAFKYVILIIYTLIHVLDDRRCLILTWEYILTAVHVYLLHK